MELVILSTLAAVAILVVELTDLARRARVDRPETPSVASSPAVVSDCARITSGPSAERAAQVSGLDRAA